MVCGTAVIDTKDRRRLNKKSSPNLLQVYQWVASSNNVNVAAIQEKASGFAHRSCFDSLKKLKKLEHEIEDIKRVTLNAITRLQSSLQISDLVCHQTAELEQNTGSTPKRGYCRHQLNLSKIQGAFQKERGHCINQLNSSNIQGALQKKKRPLHSPDKPHPKRKALNTPTRR